MRVREEERLFLAAVAGPGKNRPCPPSGRAPPRSPTRALGHDDGDGLLSGPLATRVGGACRVRVSSSKCLGAETTSKRWAWKGEGNDISANSWLTPICFDMIEEAYMTKCGHSFCYKSIHQSLEDNKRCPKCNYVVDNIDHLYPNFLVNELILKQKQRFEAKRFKLDHSFTTTVGSSPKKLEGNGRRRGQQTTN
ncbi:uncharacterized protein LOC131187273 isoform X2 [Ahaetulla prasina]|uniref:uncharacterized protein LOC131187273 isoform X2 n=1 Tax=Ahaetulla prasina TaxID=499056 RepID=UPI0026478BAD|nr:uncharacterized protein LOC131187273 isoform X2 [Ahaetulla prasina]